MGDDYGKTRSSWLREEGEGGDIERAYRSGLPGALARLWLRIEELENIADRLAATCADPVAVADYLGV
jgi:hypothetical protein